jgi:hypothetical protein
MKSQTFFASDYRHQCDALPDAAVYRYIGGSASAACSLQRTGQ